MSPPTPQTQNITLQKISAVLFDLDGTLAHTAPDLCSALNRLLLEEGRQPVHIDDICSGISCGGANILNRFFGSDADRERQQYLLERFLDYYDDILCTETRLYPGVDEVLQHLNQKEITWGIVTNKRKRFALPLVSQLFDKHLHDCLVCGDTTPSPKPAPEPLLHAADILNVNARDCVYVGDSKNDITAAHAAGMYPVAVRYGYGNYSSTPDDWGAHIVLQEITELRDWLNDVTHPKADQANGADGADGMTK